jgi:hypothetical protein
MPQSAFPDGYNVLLDAVTSISDGTPVTWIGGTGQFTAWGTFGGATCKLQFSPDGDTTWIDVGPDTTLTAAGRGIFTLAPGRIRGSITGGAGMNLNATVARVPNPTY